MERLTTKTLKGAALKMDGTYLDEGAARADLMRRYRAAVARLAAYEDTGLEPEGVEQAKFALIGKSIAEIKEFNGVPLARMIELAQAEKDVRLVVMPYKIGDLVYQIAVRGKYLNHSMETPYIKTVEIKPENAHKYITEIGKTVFLTCEEAEAALKKRGGGRR